MAKFKKDDIVAVVREAVEQNEAELVYEDTAYMVREAFDSGEPSYYLDGLNNGSKVLLTEEQEYAFVDEELEMICPKESYQ